MVIVRFLKMVVASGANELAALFHKSRELIMLQITVNKWNICSHQQNLDHYSKTYCLWNTKATKKQSNWHVMIIG